MILLRLPPVTTEYNRKTSIRFAHLRFPPKHVLEELKYPNMYIHNLMNPVQQISNKLNTYSEQFPSVLEDYKKSYIIHNKNTEYNEYSQIYASNKGALHSLNTKVFVATNDIQKNIDTLNVQISDLDNKITEEKSINTDLKKKWNSIKGTGNSASEMTDEAKELYNIQYISNVTIVIGSLGLLSLLFSTFRRPITSSV